MHTGTQVYFGLTGVLLVRDAEEDALALRSGSAVFMCVLQDRSFEERNHVVYCCGSVRGMMANTNGFFGDNVM